MGKNTELETKLKEILSNVVTRLSEINKNELLHTSQCPKGLPSLLNIQKTIQILWQLIFPDLYNQSIKMINTDYRVGYKCEMLFELLQKEIAVGLGCNSSHFDEESRVNDNPYKKATEIIEYLPELKRKLYTDISAIMRKDPAAGNEIEIILCYPVIKAMLHYRFAHLLFEMKIPFLPRIISELAHSETGVDIHPGAKIDDYFAIDHGTGVVIGETSVIGKNVTIYQGVTLGAKSFSYDDQGLPLNIDRHPIIEDNVTIYSNASILGRITIGHNSIIGGNVWVTEDVKPYSRIIQGMTRSENFTDGAGI